MDVMDMVYGMAGMRWFRFGDEDRLYVRTDFGNVLLSDAVSKKATEWIAAGDDEKLDALYERVAAHAKQFWLTEEDEFGVFDE